MALMLSKTYDALLAAGVDKATAEAAASELAGYGNRFAKIETDLLLLKWLIGTHIGLSLAIGVPAIWLLLRIATKTGALL